MDKLYYSSGEVAEMFEVNTSLIRFWEKEFPELQPRKNKKGNRKFTEADIRTIRLIHHLLKERGFTIEGAKKKLKENREDTERVEEVVHRLQEIKTRIQTIRDQL